MLDFNSKTAEREAAVSRLSAVLDQALEKASLSETPRDYLGVSSIGKTCARAVQYEYLKTPKDPGSAFDAQKLRMFAAGHAYEAMAVKWFRAAGFDLRTHTKDGDQFGFSQAGGKFRGHIDGVLCGGPPVMQFCALWEHKAPGNKSWREMVSKGIAKARPVYWAQVQLYMAYMGLAEHPALFTATNRDTLELHHEFIPFEPAVAQQYSDRAAQIIQASEAGETLPRHTADEAHFECRSRCSYRQRCWS
jgi:hypothetical protein